MKTIGVVYWNSGSGIGKDIAVLRTVLGELGYGVREVVTRDRRSRRERVVKFLKQWLGQGGRKKAVQLHVEQLHREQFRLARENLVLPNPELTDGAFFRKLHVPCKVLAKSRHAVQLFEGLGLEARYVGFTTPDARLEGIEKDFGQFLHVAGRSRFKGTEVLARVWRRHPEWPTLTVVQSDRDCYGTAIPVVEGSANIRVVKEWLSETELARLRNRSGIHVCPSEMEGFGHYIAEGMSCGSMVLTTDAPPMNELVEEGTGIRLGCRRVGRSYLDSRWEVEEGAVEAAVESVLGMSLEARRAMGMAARKRYEEMDTAFRERMKAVLVDWAG